MACSDALTGAGNGLCAPVAPTVHVPLECPIDTSNPCGFTDYCDGAGACAVAPAGTPCTVCSGASTVETRQCDATGSCSISGLFSECGMDSYCCDPTSGEAQCYPVNQSCS